MTRIGIIHSQLNFKQKSALSTFEGTQVGTQTLRSSMMMPQAHRQSIPSVYFQGKQTGTASAGQASKTAPLIQKLFGHPRKNMMWSLGYSIGGVMLLPIPPVATGAFCLAAIHFASASYQFLKQKPEHPANPTNTSS